MEDVITYSITCPDCDTAGLLETHEEWSLEPVKCKGCGRMCEWKKVVIPGDHPAAGVFRK